MTNNDYKWLDNCSWVDLRKYLINAYQESEVLRELNQKQFQEIERLEKLIRNIQQTMKESYDGSFEELWNGLVGVLDI